MVHCMRLLPDGGVHTTGWEIPEDQYDEVFSLLYNRLGLPMLDANVSKQDAEIAKAATAPSVRWLGEESGV